MNIDISEAVSIPLKRLQREHFCYRKGIDPDKKFNVAFSSGGYVTREALNSIVDSISRDAYLRQIDTITIFGRTKKGSSEFKRLARDQAEERSLKDLNIRVMPSESFLDLSSGIDVLFFTSDANPKTELNRDLMIERNLGLIESWTESIADYRGKVVIVSNLPEILAHRAVQIWNLPDSKNQIIAGPPTDLMRMEKIIRDLLRIKDLSFDNLDLTLGGYHSQMWPVIKGSNAITGVHYAFSGNPYTEKKDISEIIASLISPFDLAGKLQFYPWQQAELLRAFLEENKQKPSELPTIRPTGYACQRILEAIINEKSTVAGSLQKIGCYQPLFINFNISFNDGNIVFDQERWNSLEEFDLKQIKDRVYGPFDEREYGEGVFSSLNVLLSKHLKGEVQINIEQKISDEGNKEDYLVISDNKKDPVDTFRKTVSGFANLLQNPLFGKSINELDYSSIDRIFSLMGDINHMYDADNLSVYTEAEEKMDFMEKAFDSMVSSCYTRLSSDTNDTIREIRKGNPPPRKKIFFLLGAKNILEEMAHKYGIKVGEKASKSTKLFEESVDILCNEIFAERGESQISPVSENGDNFQSFRENSYLLLEAIRQAESQRTGPFGTISWESCERIYSIYEAISELAEEKEVKMNSDFPLVYNKTNSLFRNLVNSEEGILRKVLDKISEQRKAGELSTQLRYDFFVAEATARVWGKYMMGEDFDGIRFNVKKAYDFVAEKNQGV